jgi:hypothetical protein
MDMGKKMKKKKRTKGVAEKILEIEAFLMNPHTAKEIKQELKDSRGYSINSKAIMMALLYLLRENKIKRKKEGKIYKYHL